MNYMIDIFTALTNVNFVVLTFMSIISVMMLYIVGEHVYNCIKKKENAEITHCIVWAFMSCIGILVLIAWFSSLI